MNNDQSKALVAAKIKSIVENHYEPLLANIKRIEILIQIANSRDQKDDPGLTEGGLDILRSAVVFTHATLEDFLRGLGLAYLPQCSESVINEIPIAGSEDSLRPDKFFLGRLTRHRGKSIDQLICESISEHTSRKTFSSTSEIIGFLRSIGFNLKKDQTEALGQINELMKRRHSIVHRADIPQGKRVPIGIQASEVSEWVYAVKDFCESLITFDVLRSIPDATV